MNYSNKTALITGASSGIGLAFAKLLYKKNYNLVLASRNEKKLQNIKDELEKTANGASITIFPIDLSDPYSAEKLFHNCKDAKIDIDLLINNAGKGLYGEQTSLSLESSKETLILNIISLTTLCSTFAKEMKNRKSGYILNVSSMAAFQPLPKLAAYAASKSYVLNFSEALADELSKYNVVVSCLCPGATNTEFFNEAGVGNRKMGLFANKFRMSPQKVAEKGYKALMEKKSFYIPGLLNKILSFSIRFLSRKWTIKISKKIMAI